MVEFLLVPAAALVLAGLLALQFLTNGATYGPRARRVLGLLLVPAAAVGAGCALAVSSGSAWLRAGVGLAAVACGYVALATITVYRWRDAKVAVLIGDARAVRGRLSERQREVERLLWAGAVPQPAPGPLPNGAGQDWEAVLAEWLRAEPAQTERRRHQAGTWEAEFRRAGATALAARSRVLEASWREAPEGPERLARRARLAALWLVLQSLGEPAVDASEPPTASATRLAVARQEVARLQEELDHLLQQRSALLRQRLPLE